LFAKGSMKAAKSAPAGRAKAATKAKKKKKR
jgi:hypothetical protein